MTATQTGTRRSWGFRARLAALIAGVFILGGAGLLTVQYVLVQQLLHSSIQTLTVDTLIESPLPGLPSDGTSPPHTTAPGTGTGLDMTLEQTAFLSQDLLSNLLIWSIVVLIAFAGLAVLAGSWLSKRSLGRIARITATARELTRDDLHRRLDLSGPGDEIKELGDTIDEMLERLDDAFTRQEQFIASASHELRTPLTTTRSALEIPLAQGRVPEDLEPEVRRALAANERSEQLIAALLDLARHTHDTPRASETADISAVITDCIAQQQDEARRRDISIKLSVPPHALVAAAPAVVSIAITNLIDNAVRHGSDGRELSITVTQDDDAVRLTVTNEGPELTQAETSRLTNPFNRGDATLLAGGGIGLGLTIVETIARTSRGALTLTPRSGGGLIAELRLPACA